MQEEQTVRNSMEDFYVRHGYEDSYRRTLERVADIDKELVRRFCEQKATKDVCRRRLIKIIHSLRSWRDNYLPNKPFLELTHEDINGAVRKLNDRQDYSERTKTDLKKILKNFFRYITGKKEPDQTTDIVCAPNVQKLPPEPELLTEEEIGRLLNACTNDRDRCLLAVLAESGARIQEVLTLKFGSVKKHETGHGYRVTIWKSKGKPRRITVAWAEPYVSKWLAMHPTKNEDDFLFLGTFYYSQKDRKSKITHHRLMSYGRARVMLLQVARDAGVNKRLFFHLFRKCSATIKSARGWNMQKLCAYHGWSQNSRQVARYIFNRPEDADDDIFQDAGIRQAQKPALELAPRVCYRCSEVNGCHNRICEKCGTPLDAEAIGEAKEKQKEELKKMLRELLKAGKIPPTQLLE